MKNYKINFIVNLQARNGYCKKIWEIIHDVIETNNICYDVFFTKYSGHATEIAEKIGKVANGDKVLLIAVGGDGTVHELVNGAVNYNNVVVANIPAGSGNDFSRGFNIPRNPIDALNLILNENQCKEIQIDIGKLIVYDKRHYFANNMGAGFDALITSEANKSKMKKFFNFLSLGTLVYVYILLKKLFTYNVTEMEIIIDGKKYFYPAAWFVTISNQPYYGGGMKIAPKASATDGKLDIIVVTDVSRIKILFLFLSVFWGGHTNFKGVKCFRGHSVKVTCNKKVPIHADGEYVGKTPFEIEIIKEKLSILQLKQK